MILTNARHEKFAQAVAMGRHQNKAYEEAGFAARGPAACTGSMELRRRPEVEARIAELQEEAMEEYRLNRKEFLDYLVDVIETPAGQVKQGDRLCSSYCNTDKVRSARMPDKLRAAEMLAKLCGWFAAEKQRPSGPVEVIVRIAPEPGKTEEAPEPERIVKAKQMMLRNLRQEKFALGVAGGKSLTQAYEQAGYQMKLGTGSIGSRRLMGKPEVKGRIAELQREAEGECRWSCGQLLNFLVAVMLTPAGEVTEDNRLCQSFYHTEQMKSLRMPDKLRAAELVVKIHGWNEPEKMENSYPQDRVIRIGGYE